MWMVLGSTLSSFLGSLVAVTVLVPVAVAGWAAFRQGTAKQAASDADHWREAFESEHTLTESLQAQLVEQRELKHQVMAELAAEKHKTDLTGLMKLVAEQFDTVNRRIDGVEKRVQEGFDRFLVAQDAQTEALQAITRALSDR